MATTSGMKRGGFYDDHSEYQRRVAASGAELIRTAIQRIPPPGPGATYVIADYGSSTGRNSIGSLRTAVDAVRGIDADRPIAAIHNDLPTNDWNTLFANLTADEGSYLHATGPSVLPLASAVSFFEPATPARAVHLGMSFSAAHWLREQPAVTVPGGFYFCEATGKARAALAQQAADDWTTFLRARATDLASGGRIIVQMVGTDTPAAPGEPRVTARALLQAMAEVADEMAHDGVLDPAAVEGYLLPVYARTLDEIRAPFARAPVDAELTLETAADDRVANPYLDKWQEDHDATAYAKAYVMFVRGFTESSLREHLFTAGTRSGTPAEATDEFFARLERRFAANPERDAFEDWTVTMVAARR